MARGDSSTPAPSGDPAGAADTRDPANGGPGEGGALSFEGALERLESVVDRLEGGDLELEEALRSFEEGVRLTRQCAEQLDSAERRIEVLMKEGDDWVARPFAEEDTEAEDAEALED